MQAFVRQLSVSPGGVPKLPVASALVSTNGIEGDKQKNLKYHGGPDRAVCLFSIELYDAVREKGDDLFPGCLGENFTTEGLDLLTLKKGSRLTVGKGGTQIEITDVRVPCKTIDRWGSAQSLPLHKRIEGRSGWVAKVVSEGRVAAGDEIRVLP